MAGTSRRVLCVCLAVLAGCAGKSVVRTPSPPRLFDAHDIAGRLGLSVEPDLSNGHMIVLAGERGTIVFSSRMRGILVRDELCFRDYRVVMDRGRVSLPAGFFEHCEKALGPREPRPKPPPPPPVRVLAGFRVVLDPGHGGRDPGALGVSGRYEKTVNLAVARRIAAKLRAAGADVVLTRSRDVFVELNDRAAIGNRLRAHVFVSIHADHCPRPERQGFSVYVVHTKPEYSDARRAVKIHSECGLSRSACRAILAANRPRSLVLARLVRREMARATPMPDRGTRLGAFRVVERSLCPAILIELGYLSNREEERLLFTAAYREKLSGAIARAVTRFLRDLHIVRR